MVRVLRRAGGWEWISGFGEARQESPEILRLPKDLKRSSASQIAGTSRTSSNPYSRQHLFGRAAPVFLRQVHAIDWRRENRAFETLLISVMYFEVVHICRLWEPADPAGFSIPSLAGLVDDAEVLAIAEREIVESLEARPEDKTRLAAENIRGAAPSHRKDRGGRGIVGPRTTAGASADKEVAHAILWTAREKAGPRGAREKYGCRCAVGEYRRHYEYSRRLLE